LRRNWGWPYSACGGGFSSSPHAGIVWKAVRNAVDAIITGATQADIFGEIAPLQKENELAVVRSMEKGMDKIASRGAHPRRIKICQTLAIGDADNHRRPAGARTAVRQVLSFIR